MHSLLQQQVIYHSTSTSQQLIQAVLKLTSRQLILCVGSASLFSTACVYLLFICVYISVCLSLYLYICLSICLPICLSICLSICLVSICLYVFLSLMSK